MALVRTMKLFTHIRRFVSVADLSLYKGLNLNLPILHTPKPKVIPVSEPDELHYFMELEAITTHLPSPPSMKQKEDATK